jgi:hypothetical protein
MEAKEADKKAKDEVVSGLTHGMNGIYFGGRMC